MPAKFRSTAYYEGSERSGVPYHIYVPICSDRRTMSTTSTSTVLVDDSDPRVQYKPGWQWQPGVTGPVDGTRHGAAEAGLTASLAFTGTGIQVVGSLGPVETSGSPDTTYSIDGQLAGSYTAPFVPSGRTQLNVTFFSKRDLPYGDHEVLITNVNGTSPNVFWLIFFLVDTSPSDTSSTATTSSILLPSSPSDQGITHSAGVSSTVDDPVAGSQTPSAIVGKSPASDIPRPGSRTNIGAIAGGSVAGAVVLIVLVTLLACVIRRRRHAMDGLGPTPFHTPSDRLASASKTHVARSTPDTRMVISDDIDVLPSSPAHLRNSLSHTFDTISTTATAPVTTLTSSCDSNPHMMRASTTLNTLASQPGPGVAMRPPPSSLPLDSHASPPSDLLPSKESTEASKDPPTASSRDTTVSARVLASAPVLPPGVWHAPPGTHSRARALVRALFSRRSDAVEGVPVMQDVDSGLRLYDNVVLPPPYTQD
ncbi:hypothetical protein BD413DRAFT_301491 [Trametes elegans]|nr:hypothetical protein BD413DRAFT_301491 [Trametes elegans]